MASYQLFRNDGRIQTEQQIREGFGGKICAVARAIKKLFDRSPASERSSMRWVRCLSTIWWRPSGFETKALKLIADQAGDRWRAAQT